ncbi:MAG: hypothetical protein WC506_01215 [Candidatus Micrarchaeia archaeon]
MAILIQGGGNGNFRAGESHAPKSQFNQGNGKATANAFAKLEPAGDTCRTCAGKRNRTPESGKARIYRKSKKQLNAKGSKDDIVGINAKSFLEYLTMDCEFGHENPEMLQALIDKAPPAYLEGLLGTMVGIQTEYPELVQNVKKLVVEIQDGEELARAVYAYKGMLDRAPRNALQEEEWNALVSITDAASKPNIALKIKVLERFMDCAYKGHYWKIVPWASGLKDINQKEMLELMHRHLNDMLRKEEFFDCLTALWNFSKHSRWKGEYCEIIDACIAMADQRKLGTCLMELYGDFEMYFTNPVKGAQEALDRRDEWKGKLGLTEKNWWHWLGNFFKNMECILELELEKPGAAMFLHDKAGITFFGRYTTDTLLAQYENYGKRDKSRRLMLALNSLSDHNGSFYEYGHDMEDLSKEFDLKIVEAGTTGQAARKIISASAAYGKIGVLWVGGHGSVKTITLSEEKRGLVVADKVAIGGDLSRYFIKKPTLVLVSCSTGSDAKNSVANMVAGRYKNVLIYAPKIPTSLQLIKTRQRDGNGWERFDILWHDAKAAAEFNG